MTVSLRISKSKTLYLFFAILAIMILALIAQLWRGEESDVIWYYRFYNHLAEHGITNWSSCQAHEPLYCGVSYLFVVITGTPAGVQYLWTVLFYSLTLVAFLQFWSVFMTERKYCLLSFIVFVFVAINYVDPASVYLIIRAYVAASFLVLGVARVARGKSAILPVLIAGLIHFGSIPLGLAIIVATQKKMRLRPFIIGFTFLALVLYVAWVNNFLQLYMDSILSRFSTYADKNDGDVSILRDVKLLLYFALAIYVFKLKSGRLVLAYSLMYLFYLCVIPNVLYHLRYHFDLLALSWPSVFGLLYLAKKARGELVVAATSYRIYNYLSIVVPEATVTYMGKILLMSLLAAVSAMVSVFSR